MTQPVVVYVNSFPRSQYFNLLGAGRVSADRWHQKPSYHCCLQFLGRAANAVRGHLSENWLSSVVSGATSVSCKAPFMAAKENETICSKPRPCYKERKRKKRNTKLGGMRFFGDSDTIFVLLVSWVAAQMWKRIRRCSAFYLILVSWTKRSLPATNTVQTRSFTTRMPLLSVPS